MSKVSNHESLMDRIVLVLFCLNYIRFYNLSLYVHLGSSLTFLDTLFNIYFFLFAMKIMFHSNTCFIEKIVFVLYVIFFNSIIIAMFGGQSFYYGFRGIQQVFMPIGVYFYLRYKNFSPRFVLKVLVALSVGYMIVNLLCYLQYPTMWFGNTLAYGTESDMMDKIENEANKRGVLRFVLPCKVLVTFMIFKLVSKYDFKLESTIKLGIVFVFLIIMGQRFLIATTLLGVFYLCFFSSIFNQRNKFFLAFLLVVFTGLFLILPITRNIIDSSVEYTSEKEDIRVFSSVYFFTEFNQDNAKAIVFGNGIPVKGSYADKLSMAHDVGFWEVDVGFCCIYIYFGVIGLIALFAWTVALALIKVDVKWLYCKVFCIIMVITMITGGAWFENIAFVMFVNYILVANRLPSLKIVSKQC